MPSFFERSPFVPRLVTTGLLFGLLLLLLHVLLPRQLALVATFGMEHETDNQSEGLRPSTYPDCRQTYASLSLSPVCLCTQKKVDVATHRDPPTLDSIQNGRLLIAVGAGCGLFVVGCPFNPVRGDSTMLALEDISSEGVKNHGGNSLLQLTVAFISGLLGLALKDHSESDM